MWNTIYIKGKGDFRRRIRKQLSKSSLVEGKDYIEGSTHHNYELYWISPKIALREFKLRIGAKYVWKHRLQFQTELKDKKINFTPTQEELDIIKMEISL